MSKRRRLRVARYDRVYRPPGLSIAILATALLYGIMPLGEVYFLERIRATAADTYLLGGVDFSSWTLLQGLFGGIMLLVCIFSWWGRPAKVRFVLVGLLLIFTVVNLYRIIEAWTSTVNPVFGGQTQTIEQNFLRCQLPAMILVPLYVIWYINRAPARAFYRRIPLSTLTKTEKNSSQENDKSSS